MPGLSALRLANPTDINWHLVETELGCGLPADYKLLCQLYPPFILGDFLGVGGPAPGQEVAWARDSWNDLEDVAEWCTEADLAVPMHPYPAPGGLLPWAGSYQGDLFLWTTTPASPDEWTVTVASRSSAWWHYSGGAVQFLADLVSGAVQPWALPRVRAEATAC